MAGSFVDTLAGQTMNLDLSKSIGKGRDMVSLCTDLLLITIRMREAENLGKPEALRKLVNYYLELFEKNCASVNAAPDSIADAKYVLVALLDETVLSVPGECRDYWLSRPLQLDHFGNSLAGEEVYTRLEKLIARFDTKKDVLEVYYLCLSLGFEGKFRLGNPEERIRIVDDLGKKLRKSRIRMSSSLSPHGKPRSGFINKKQKKGVPEFPLWLTGVIGAGGCIALYLVLFFSGKSQVGALVESLQRLTVR